MLVLVLGASLAIVGCSGSDGDDESAGSRTTSTEASPAAGTDSSAGSSTAGTGSTTTGGDAGSHDSAGDEMATFTLTSSFTDGTSMPATYACKRAGGGEKSPPLSWTGVPDGTERLVLVVHDPDAPAAGGFTHLVTDLPLDTDHVDEAANADRNGPMADWIPACPPSGEHHYNFTLYAFGADVDLAADPDKAAVDAVADQALGTATLTGLFAAPS